ncbi:MAG: M12 family metallopeptidase [Acidobacteria bacterium]|nr:M12 family metallopeptidase [Acidobacteriota bacterium]
MRILLALLFASTIYPQAPDWRETEINGRRIRYQVVEGEALVGDIVLGPVSDVESKANRASSVVVGQRYRWPGGVVPYVIDPDVPDVTTRLEPAIRAWNDSTPVRLVLRTTETDYIQFRRRNGFACSSNVGRIGGRQFINLPDTCLVGSVTHEIGHALGLWHTQSRQDRDMFVDVDYSAMARGDQAQYEPALTDGDDVGPYPFDSIMHYSEDGFAYPLNYAMQTIPRGITIGQRTALAPSDIDTITRLYGTAPRRTTITSNPPGLTLFVDARSATTPASFDWTPGSTHTLRADDQTRDATQFVYGRWSNFGPRIQTITAAANSTVYTVHYRRMIAFPLLSSPATAGSIRLTPPSENDRVPAGSLVQLDAIPAPGFAFTNWSGFGYFSAHGSANPIRIPLEGTDLRYTASFSNAALTTITSNPPGLRVVIDGTTQTTPRRVVWAPGSTHTLAVATPSQTAPSTNSRYEFASWSPGAAASQTYTATLTADFSAQHRVTLLASPSTGGTLTVDLPLPADGFVPAGTVLTLTASPRANFTFVGWGDDAAPQVTVNRDLFLSANFAVPNLISLSGTVNAASQLVVPIAPGQFLTLYGLAIGPAEPAGLALTAQGRVSTQLNDTRVLFNGIPAPLTYVSANQINCIVPYGVSEPSATIRVEVAGRPTNSLTFPVQAASPAFFTYNSSGLGGGAFLNQNGSVNTAANPADRGSIVVLYANGTGRTSPTQVDGEVTGNNPPRPALAVKVFIADREVELLFAGSTPGVVSGLTQLNVRVPLALDPGIVPVVLDLGGIRSPRTVSLAIR